MVYNLRSIGQSLIQNKGIKDGSRGVPASPGATSRLGATATTSTSSFNNQGGNNQGGNQPIRLGNQPTRTVSKRECKNTNHSNAWSVRGGRQVENAWTKKKETVIELDSSLDDSTIIGIECDASNNSNHYSCAVLNCEAVFTSEGALGHHMNQFKHSPCNPCIKARDCKLPPDPLCFMCPECDSQFATGEECSKHMKTQYHCVYLPPLHITAYMCPQCLHLFESFDSCWNHMSESTHQNMSYPFADDRGSEGGVFGPVPVPEQLVQDFMEKCAQVHYTVQCLECSMQIATPAILRNHRRETHEQHIISSLTDASLVDVFAGYLARYSCDVCHRLFNSTITELAEHQCSRTIIGKITENDTTSFTEFIKRCALTLIKSLDMGCEPGPSSRGTSYKKSPSPRKRSKKRRSRSRSDSREHDVTAAFIPKKQPQKSSSKLVVYDLSDSSSDDCNEVSIVQPLATLHETQPPSVGTKRKSSSMKDKKRNCEKNHEKIVIDLSNSAHDLSEVKIPNMPGSINATTAAQVNTSVPLTGFEFFNSDSPMYQISTDYVATAGTSKAAARRPHSSPAARRKQPTNNTGPVAQAGVSSQQGRYPLRNQANFDVASTSPCTQKEVVQREEEEMEVRTNDLPGPSRGVSHKNHSRIDQPQQQQAESADTKRKRSRSPLDALENPISTANLTRMRHIIFLDLDNWPGFFSKLPRVLPDLTFVWGFYGGRVVWREPQHCYVFSQMKTKNCFHLHERCGVTKDAADFAIVLTVGAMHERLPKDIAFTILSGDKGFLEVERQMKNERRSAIVIDPHKAQRNSNNMIYIMVTSVTDK